MAVAITDLREHVDDNEPGSVNLSIKGGKAKMSYWWTSTDVDDFSALGRLILGTVAADAAGGANLNRGLPLRHPRFPSLFAESIGDFAGLGSKFIKETSAAPEGAPVSYQFPEYARYPEYRIDVEFANRLYPVLSDAELGATTVLDWNDDNGSGVDVAKKCWKTLEWNRWCWATGGPKENLLTAKQGQMVLDTWDPSAGGMKFQVFPDMPKLALPDGAVKFTWFEVPYNFVRPTIGGMSFFQQYMGRVNQFPFLNWNAGELLYITIQPRPYTTPLLPAGAVEPQTLCDIDILCLETSRAMAVLDTEPPAPTGPSPPAAAQGRLYNWLAAGWNLQPWWYDRQFHYAHVGNLGNWPLGSTVPLNRQIPVWRSFPFEILFSNPNVDLPP
jgi:hypothetical protein